jgi:mannose-6-phosphate isomerase
MEDNTPMYPLKFAPIYKEKVWGGRTLEKLGRKLPGDEGMRIGESWELVDLGRTSASGGGGGAERSVVVNGKLAGRTLHAVMEMAGRAVMGDLKANEFGEFPLLVKFLDARENLSVQVHPSAAYAAAHKDAFIKNEAWYIVDCEPGAVIYRGIEAGVTAEEFREAIEKDAVEGLLVKVPVKPGDFCYLPSGTCHALGAGVMVAEVQTPSDTTFRVYDWGRKGRELHVEQALECIEFGAARAQQEEKLATVRGAFAEVTRLVVCRDFRIDKVRMTDESEQEVAMAQPVVWLVLSGEGKIRCEDGMEVGLGRGETLLLGPGMEGGRMKAAVGTEYLEVTFPQAQPVRLA